MATPLNKSSLKSRTAAPTAAATAILDVAERLTQTQGYNGFSYADIAAQLHVTKASVHYHFRSKAELGRALIERYRTNFGAALDAIEQQTREPQHKLRRYVGLYHSVLSNERMCLCGMLAAEYATLPAPMQDGLKRFFDANEQWLAALLEEGLRAGTFRFTQPAKQRARWLVGALEGALLVARSYGSARRFVSAAACVLADLGVNRQSLGRRRPARVAVRRARRA